MESDYKYALRIRIEKGLHASSLADVLTTVTDCAHYLREFPFPSFVDNVLYKLALAFQGDMFGRKFEHSLNMIRLRIVTAIRECSPSLSVAFSSEHIVQCIMKVSHSNDFKARSLTLLVLASLGPLVFDDKKVHNLVIESLDCTEQSELSAAIQAANELAKHSITFSALVLHKITEMLASDQTSHAVKVELMGIVANLRDLSIAKQCIGLEKALLACANHEIHPIAYNALTKLATREENIILDQLSILLHGLQTAFAVPKWKNKPQINCILANLSRLAAFPQYWSREHILTIRDFYPQIETLNSKFVLCKWLHCVEVLSSSKQHNQILIVNHPWISLLKSDDIMLRVLVINLVLNLTQQGGTGSVNLKSLMFNAIIGTLEQVQAVQISKTISEEPECSVTLRHKFLSIVAKFVRSANCRAEEAICLAKKLLELNNQLLLPSSDAQLELLAVICDTFWAECRALVFDSLYNSLLSAASLKTVPMCAFSLLLSTSLAKCFNIEQCPLSMLLKRVIHELDHWRIYQMARSALRYGHWRHVALPLLQRIDRSMENLETKSWIMALTYIAKSQPAIFSTEELQRTERNLKCAALYLKALVSSEKDQPFWFAADYTSSMLSLFTCIRFLMTTIDVELRHSHHGQRPGGMEMRKSALTEELTKAQQLFTDLRQQWVALCSKSFDADTQTLLQMALLTRICLLMEQYLDFLVAPKKEHPIFTEIKLEDLGESTQKCVPSAHTRSLFALICWIRDQLLRFHVAGQPKDLHSSLRMLRELLQHLADFPIGLPRFFFQRVQHTKIKLIISPQPTDSRGVYRVSSLDLLPVIIEGVIESNNPKPIESVCVVLTLRRDNTAPTEKRQHIQLEQGDKYFKAQFLLKIVHQKATKINAKVYFVDSITKKQWSDETDTAALTVEVPDGTH